MMQGLAAPKIPPMMKMWRSFITWLCVPGGETRSIASEVGKRFGAVQTILTDILGVPRMLTDDQKRSQLDISRYLLSRYEDDPGDFIDRCVTKDET